MVDLVNELEGKVAIITGSARNIGRATAEELADRRSIEWLADVYTANLSAKRRTCWNDFHDISLP
jgi:NAD(P)-dependent dehydrogenase (short-subunit alcohol dehydrogenase family)